MGVIFRVEKNWRVIPSFRKSIVKILGQVVTEDNPRLTIIRVWEKDWFVFANRNRFEYRSLRDNFLYRNHSMLQFPKLLNDKVSPFLSDEIFLDKLKNLRQNRAKVGLELDANKWKSSSINYMHRWRKVRNVTLIDHVIQIELDLMF